MMARILILLCTWIVHASCAQTPTNAAPPVRAEAARMHTLASLMRVSIDGQPTGTEILEKSFNYESILLRHAGNRDYRYVDLTPLKDDFQRLRYSHQCAIVDDRYDRDACADFGNYSNAVLQVLENIEEGRKNEYLPNLNDNDRILLGDTQIRNSERKIRVEMYMRVYGAGDSKLLYSDTLSREMQLGAKASREAMTIKLLNLVLEDGIHKLATTNP